MPHVMEVCTMALPVKATKTIDARGSFCPGPLMELIGYIRTAPVGEVIEVLSTDTGSRTDIPHWTQKAGHEFIGVESRGDHDAIIVRKTH